MGTIRSALILFLLAGCADFCKDSEKVEVTEVGVCDEDQRCLATLADGTTTWLISPKVGERVCP